MAATSLTARVMACGTWNVLIPVVLLFGVSVTTRAQTSSAPPSYPMPRGSAAQLVEANPILNSKVGEGKRVGHMRLAGSSVSRATTMAYNVSGVWTDSWGLGYVFTFAQSASGNVSGTANYDTECSVPWPISGSVSGNLFTFTGTNPTGGSDGCAVSNEYELTLSSDGESATGIYYQTESNGVIYGPVSVTLYSQGFVCPSGTTIPVTLPSVSVTPTISIKPWQITYGALPLTFSVSDSSAQCNALSNSGALPVYFDSYLIANSVAVAQLSVYQPSTVGVLQSCSFALFSSTTNNCLLNGPYDPNASYTSWSTTGFKTVPLPTVQSLIPGPGTGPLTFWVNLDALGVPTSSSSMDAIVTTAEPYIHKTLIANLPYFAWYTVVQDPGNVSILVINSNGLTAGTLPGGRGTTFDIPQSLNFPSASNPAVVFQNVPDGNYQIILTGLSSGGYELSVSGTNDNKSSQQVVNGAIVQNASVAYQVTLTTTIVGQVQTVTLGTVVPGDLNGDEVVNCKDLAVVQASFGKRKGQQGYNAWADINGDGVVNIIDLMFVARRIPAGTSCTN
jgi:hypothetical protein